MDGKIAAGAATSWKTAGNSVTFVLATDADGAAIAKLLNERLASAKATFADGKLTVRGIPEAALLEQLAGLSLSGGDPLADIADLDAVVAMQAPEAGGSIRAGRPAESHRPRIIKPHDDKERVVAEVIAVTRGTFPTVTLKLKLRGSAKAGPLKRLLRRGKVIEAAVVVAADEGGVLFENEHTQRNLGAYYLSKGDKVILHATSAGDKKIEIDYIERK